MVPMEEFRLAKGRNRREIGNRLRAYTMRFFAYILGFLILIGGLAWAAITAGAPTLYVQIGSVILLGLGIIMGASRTRRRGAPGDVTVVRDQDLP